MGKQHCTKFVGVLISFHKVMKLQGFQSGVSDALQANVQNISYIFLFAYFVNFMKK